MFERDAEGGWTAVHHPFTAPAPEWADRFGDDPEHALAQAYDIVCNGNEIGGGSIRIHRSAMQQRVFEIIGLSKAEAEAKFGFLLEAFQYGPPPHGGIALRLGPGLRAAHRRGVDPRGDRVPEDGLRRRPAHRRADADPARAAAGGRRRRAAAGAAGAAGRRGRRALLTAAGTGAPRRSSRPRSCGCDVLAGVGFLRAAG